jgi:hypothetical protein
MLQRVNHVAGEVLTRHFGALPPREVKARVTRAPQTARLRVAEEREVARARRLLTAPPPATFATIIPTIGRPYLLDAVESALAQTVTDQRIVVVSDGFVVPRLPDDRRLTVWTLQRNCGAPAVVRNVGIRISRSRYVAFLDDDNTWERTHLASLLPALQCGADLAYAGWRWVDENNHVLAVETTPFDRLRLAEENFIDTSVTAVRRASSTRFRVIPRRRHDATYEDWELAWRVSRRGTVAHVPAVTANVRVHSDSCFMVRSEIAGDDDEQFPDAIAGAGAL